MGVPLGVNNLTTKLMIENQQSSEKFVAGLARLSAFGVARCRPPGSCCTCGSREAEVGQEEAFDIDAEIVDNWYLPLSLRLDQKLVRCTLQKRRAAMRRELSRVSNAMSYYCFEPENFEFFARASVGSSAPSALAVHL